MRPVSTIAALCFLALGGAAFAQEAGVTPPLPPALMPFAEALMPVPANFTGLVGRTYVPVYSTVMAADGATRIDFSVTLSIHNGSAGRPIAIERIGYFDTAGRLVGTPLEQPVLLKPYGTVQVVVGQRDVSGGLGANFVVDWTSPVASAEPIIEAVMLSSHGNQSYGFVTLGRKVER